MRAIALALLLSLSPCWGTTLTVTVDRVVDGDTVVLGDKAHRHVRLQHIDAPELKQPFGPEARDFLRALLKNSRVVLTYGGKDLYGRLLGTLSAYTPRDVKHPVDVQEALLSSGHAWAYKDEPMKSRYSVLQAKARQEKRGLWAGTPVPPWIWRKKK